MKYVEYQMQFRNNAARDKQFIPIQSFLDYSSEKFWYNNKQDTTQTAVSSKIVRQIQPTLAQTEQGTIECIIKKDWSAYAQIVILFNNNKDADDFEAALHEIATNGISSKDVYYHIIRGDMVETDVPPPPDESEGEIKKGLRLTNITEIFWGNRQLKEDEK